MPSTVFTLVAALIAVALGVDSVFTCKNMNDEAVDWYMFYKYPRQRNGQYTDPKLGTGAAFMYMDSDKPDWIYPTQLLNETNHALWFTLQQFYENKDNVQDNFYILYNDEFPNSTIWSPSSGHQKGVALFDKQQGFWLIHSIPKFPANQSYNYPPTAYEYGQMGICISLSYADNLAKIARQLFFTQPFVYTMNVPTAIGTDIPQWIEILNGGHQLIQPFGNYLTLKTLKGEVFWHFAKTGLYGKDIFYDFISKTFATDLYVQSWTHTARGNNTNNLNSTCTPGPYKVFDADNIETPFYNFTSYRDHSKYAIAHSPYTPFPYLCIADNNRQVTQTHRGGGALCLLNTTVFSVFSKLIATAYPCKK
uniref:Deoxyribonuclease II n=1 Tax=Panagrellus redivivus TaxID=6233 RepID=A0A7E4VZ24_PANRE